MNLRSIALFLFAASISAALIVWSGMFVDRMLSGAAELADLNRTWVKAAAAKNPTDPVRDLFEKAVRAELIRYDPDEDAIKVVRLNDAPPSYDPAAILARQKLLRSRPPDAHAKEAIQEALWASRGPGAAIRREIEEMEGLRTVIAVRDSGLSESCPAMRVEECEVFPWLIGLAAGGRSNTKLTLRPTVAMREGWPDPLLFRALNRTKGLRFSGWSRAVGADISGFQFTLVPHPDGDADAGADSDRGDITIDVVGRIDQPPPQAEAQFYCINEVSEHARVGLTPCNTAAASFAARLRLPLVLSEGLELKAYAVRRPLLPPALRTRLFKNSGPNAVETASVTTIPVGPRIQMRCLPRACVVEYSFASRTRRLTRDLRMPSSETPDAPPPDATLVAAEATPPRPGDGREVVSPFYRISSEHGARLTSLTSELGLSAAIGVPNASFGSLLAFLETPRQGVEPSDLEITFSPEAQAAALQVLQAHVDAADSPEEQDLFDNFSDRRRAAFVLLDLSEGADFGAVRAAVSLPRVDAEATAWDLSSREAAGETDGATPYAWRGLDGRLQPGSSIKMLSALSLARAALGQNGAVGAADRPLLETAILGGKPSFYEENFELNLNATTFIVAGRNDNGFGPLSVSDRGSTVALAKDSQVRKACSRKNAGYGLCEALARSSNIWFTALALRENARVIEQQYDADGAPGYFSGAAQTLEALGLDRELPLVRLASGMTGPPWAEAPVMASAPGLASGTPKAKPEERNELDIALNAYGQNMQITPLALASIAGAIARNRVVRPFIATAPDVAPPPAQSVLPETDAGLRLREEILRGLRAVMSPGGTGHNAFGSAGSLRKKVWGKTGTATIGEIGGKTIYSHWFAGWITGRDAAIPRWAFACAVTHVNVKRAPCPRITAEILTALAEKGRL